MLPDRLSSRREHLTDAALDRIPKPRELVYESRRRRQSIERSDDQLRISQQRARARQRGEASGCLSEGFGDVLEGEFAVLHCVCEGAELVRDDVDVLARFLECGAELLADCVDDVRQRLLDLVEGRDQPLFDGGFKVAPRAFKGRSRLRGLLCDVGEAEVHQGLVELFRRDLAFGHRVPEVSGKRCIGLEGFLDFPRCAGDCPGYLVPILRREFACAVDLDERERDLLECLFRSAGNGIDIAGGLRHLVEILNSIGGELRGHRLDVRQVIYCLICVGLSCGGQLLDSRGVDASEFECFLEFVCSVARCDCRGDLSRERGGDAADGGGDAAKSELSD